MLLRWLAARYPTHHISEEAWKSLSQSSWHSHELVTEAFLGLARQQHTEGHLDPEVQIGLGVLFYTNSEFDRAKDCFEVALTVRPNVSLKDASCIKVGDVYLFGFVQDYLLWNRLGSSLSNGNNPEEALGAYREALQLRPTYTRAIYNVGVACTYMNPATLKWTFHVMTCVFVGLNIGANKEAAEHFLSALAMQDSSAGAKSDQLWFTLRRAFLSMVCIHSYFPLRIPVHSRRGLWLGSYRIEWTSLASPRRAQAWTLSERKDSIFDVVVSSPYDTVQPSYLFASYPSSTFVYEVYKYLLESLPFTLAQGNVVINTW